MRTRTATVGILAVLALTLTACSSDNVSASTSDKPKTTTAASTPASSPKDADTYDSAQDIVDALTAAGLKASAPEEQAEANYISEVGGTSYTLTITDGNGQAPGEAGINLFPNPEALAAWIPLSKQFGGVAVTGDTWAVSLPTRDQAATADSKRLAPKVATALGGTVQQ